MGKCAHEYIDDIHVTCAGASKPELTAVAVPHTTIVTSKAAAAADVAPEQGQAASTPAVRPAMTESDISEWIQLPRQGSKSRVTNRVPSAEEPWQVSSVSAALCCMLCCAVLCCAVLCCAVLCCAVLCCAVLCCAVLCCAVLKCS